MKKTAIFAASLLLGIFVSCSPNKTTTFHISFEGDNTPEVVFSDNPPVYVVSKTSLTPDDLPDYKIEQSKIELVCVSGDGRQAIFYAEPGKTYDIKLPINERGDLRVIDDPVASLYDSLLSTKDRYKYEWVKDFTQFPLDTDAVKMQANFDEVVKQEKSLYDGLQMSPKLRKLIYKDIDIYWAATQARVIRKNFSDSKRQNVPMYDGYMEAWQELFKKYPISDGYKDTYSFGFYLNEYVFFLSNTGPDSEKYNYRFSEIAVAEYNIEGKENLQAARLYYLVNYIINNKTRERSLIEPIMRYVESYPDNKYNKMMLDHVAEIEAFHEKADGEFASDMILWEDCGSVNEALAKFKGRPVFLDFWFSTCGPCIEEFGHSSELKKFLKENGIELLYVSIDSDEMDMAWKNAIKGFGLAGYNIRLSHYTDKFIAEHNVYSYPRYMLADKDGKIILEHGPYPSSGELIPQIKKALSL